MELSSCFHVPELSVLFIVNYGWSATSDTASLCILFLQLIFTLKKLPFVQTQTVRLLGSTTRCYVFPFGFLGVPSDFFARRMYTVINSGFDSKAIFRIRRPVVAFRFLN